MVLSSAVRHVVPNTRISKILSTLVCHDACHVPGLAPIFLFSLTITSPSFPSVGALEGLLFCDVISLTHICVLLLRPMTVVLRTYSSLFSYLWYDVFITYTLCLVLPMICPLLSCPWPTLLIFLLWDTLDSLSLLIRWLLSLTCPHDSSLW